MECSFFVLGILNRTCTGLRWPPRQPWRTTSRQILEGLGYTFDAIVLDGRHGIRGVFGDIPVQLCQYHQIATIRRYLTNRPKLEAGKELRIVSLALPELDEPTFTGVLNEWYEKWCEFLKERILYGK